MTEESEDEGDVGEGLASLAREKAERAQGLAGVKQEKENERRGTPKWYRMAAPMLFIVGGVLMVIGLWAAGAVMYMNKVTPMAAEDVKYPLLRWSDEVGTSGGYAPESRMMAMGMLLCIPLAIAMAVMVMILRRQIRGARMREAERGLGG